jgi:preprotein translocase subunit SecG
VLHLISVILIVIASLGIIAIVLLQSGKSEGLSGAITGGAEQLFGKQKARGIDGVLLRITIVFAVIFYVVAFILAFYA